MVRIPQITSIETALTLYYSKIELRNSDIKELFGNIGSNRITGLKRLADEKTAEMGIMKHNAAFVNTRAAYIAWGLDSADLETRYKKLRALEGRKW